MALKNVVWDKAAILDLDLIYLYYHSVSANAAFKLRKALVKQTARLAKLPNSGPADFEADSTGTIRYIVYKHWRIYYKVLQDDVLVFKLFDMRQNPKRKLSDTTPA